jgi:hypothetical protein
MYWVSVIFLGVLHYCFHKGRRCRMPAEEKTIDTSSETPPVQADSPLPASGPPDNEGESGKPANPLETESDPWQRHVLYTQEIETAYRDRKASRDAHDRAIDLAENYIRELPDLKQAVFDRLGDEPKVISVFKQLAIILEEDGEYDRAVAICRAALANGIDDGTRTGFAGRINRILKKAAMSAQ